MIYEKEKIKRIIEYKDNINDIKIKNDLEWILASYNEYFINSREYEMKTNAYKDILNKYYNAEEEKESIKQQFIILKRKYQTLKQICGSCTKNKSMI